MSPTDPKPLTATSAMPSYTVDDIARSEAFFTALGFTVDDRWEENGVVLGLMLKAGSVLVGLSQDDGKKGRDRVKGVGLRLYIETTDDIDEAAARAKAAGVTLSSEPHDTEWGSRAFEVTEPSGFLLTISSPTPKK